MQYGPKIVTDGLILDLDAADINSYSPNVLPNPTDIFAWCGAASANNCTLSRDTTITRQYGSIPLKMVISGNDPYIASYNSPTWNLSAAATGQTWTVSVYVKASVATNVEGPVIFECNSSGTYLVATSAGSISVTTSWTRISYSRTFSNASTAYIQTRLVGTPTGGSGITIWWDGLQVERASAATTFNPYYYGDAIWRDFSGNGRNATLINKPLFSNTNKGILTFDGSTQYAATSSMALSYYTFSMECLVKYNSLSGNQGLFTYNGANVINLWKGSGLGMRWEVNTSSQAITGANDLATGVWYHFVGVYNGSQGILYRNGIVYAGPTTLTSHISDSTTFEVGRYNGAGNTNGSISVARFYNRALTATEVSQNYNTTKARFGL